MSPTLTALDNEWHTLTRDPATRTALRRWARDEPALTGHRTLAGVLDARRDPARSGPVTEALARLAIDDTIAARTLLQALLPGIVRLACRYGPRDSNALDELVAIAWERIRTYPTTRQGSVAANILLDIRKRYRLHNDIERGLYDQRLELPDAGSDRSPEDIVVERDLVEHLVEAWRRGMVSDLSLRAIALTRIEGQSLKDAAAAERIDVHTLVMRRWRGEQGYRAHLGLAS